MEVEHDAQSRVVAPSQALAEQSECLFMAFTIFVPQLFLVYRQSDMVKSHRIDEGDIALGKEGGAVGSAAAAL